MKLILVFSMLWIVLMFLVLPFGIKMPKKVQAGCADSAPEVHYLTRKFLWTAIVSVVLTWIYWYMYLSRM